MTYRSYFHQILFLGHCLPELGHLPGQYRVRTDMSGVSIVVSRCVHVGCTGGTQGCTCTYPGVPGRVRCQDTRIPHTRDGVWLLASPGGVSLSGCTRLAETPGFILRKVSHRVRTQTGIPVRLIRVNIHAWGGSA